MYIKLTRIDGSPIWLNASFIVTIEPTRNGGSIVVPIGDGLDYEVKEAAEAVLDLLNEAPPAAVVPVPPPKSLAPTAEDVSPGNLEANEIAHEHKASAPKKAAKTPAKAKKSASAGSAKKAKEASVAVKAESPVEEPGKGQPVADGTSAEPASATAPEDPVWQVVEKLKAHKCRTEKRLMNFIKSSHKTMSDADVLEVMDAMKSRGYITVEDDGHVIWA